MTPGSSRQTRSPYAAAPSISVARHAHDTILRDIGQLRPAEDLRRLHTLAWATAGTVLEQDARLARQALVLDAPDDMGARLRRLERLLSGGLDPHRFYDAVLRPHLHRWQGRTAWLVLDTSALRGNSWFVRLGLCYRHRAIPISWRTYSTRSATVRFDVYRQVLEQADQLMAWRPPLPACRPRLLPPGSL
jgi:hypothetical protein